MSKKTIFIYGKHGNRTPFSYPEYKQLFLEYFDYVDTPEEAEYLIVGFSIDLQENAKYIDTLLKTNPLLKLIVFSEEPLWDTLWSGDFQKPQGTLNRKVDNEEICLNYHILNHVTSDIFEFKNIPYFITTSNDYYLRYANLFSRNAKLTGSDFKNTWEHAQVRYAFFAAKRLKENFNVSFRNDSIVGLSRYRSLIASQLNQDGILREGEGWNENVKRQALADWHLDKLASLDNRSFIVSALENTHLSSYITEKLFDAFSVQSIPLYYAHADHDVFRLVAQDSFINLASLSTNDALDKINNFTLNEEFITKYLSTQAQLAKLFSDPMTYLNERKHVVKKTVKAFSKI